MIIVGIEAANSFVKVKVPLSDDCYLNTLREVEAFEMGDFINPDQTVYKIGSKSYIVGEPNSGSSSGRDTGRYKSEQYLNETLCGIARNVQDEQDITLVTGLPCEDYKKPQLIKDVNNNLIGTHTVFINGEKKTFSIKKVHVMIQPLGSLIYRVYDHNGRLRKGREQEQYMKTLIIDIGFGTTDIVHVEKMKPISYEGAEKGMIDAMKYLREAIIKDNPNVNGLPKGIELDNLVRDNNTIFVGGQVIDVVKAKQYAFKRTAKEIMNEVRKSGYNTKSYDKVMFTGGGVNALSEYLKDELEGVNASRLSESQLANSIGYYTYGVIKFAN